MKRLVLATGLVVAFAVTSAYAVFLQFDYEGHVKGDTQSLVGFKVEKTAAGHKRVTHFTIASLPISCNDSSDDRSSAFEFERPMRVRHREFGADGEWIQIGLDPTGSIAGKLRRGGVATGTLKARGELAGSETHCHTGPLEWRATRHANPPT